MVLDVQTNVSEFACCLCCIFAKKVYLVLCSPPFVMLVKFLIFFLWFNAVSMNSMICVIIFFFNMLSRKNRFKGYVQMWCEQSGKDAIVNTYRVSYPWWTLLLYIIIIIIIKTYDKLI